MIYVKIEDGPNGKQFVKNVCPLPLVEGKCPPEFDPETGKWYYPEPDPDYTDPECIETDNYSIGDKDEFWGYVTHCKSCGTEFQAYINGDYVRNYCPGCGKNLHKVLKLRKSR